MSIGDWTLIELAPGRDLGVKGPPTSSASDRGGRHEITDVNTRFGGAFPLPLAAGGGYPELALALARGERVEPQLGDFREGVVMTRFFWHSCLWAARDGALEPLDTELPEVVGEERKP
jgi:hypothetical protein